jgi:dihydrodipicolinate synthase/N-acetylneuraminate lyase
MGLHLSHLDTKVLGILRQGTVIPAHPLALNRDRSLDRTHQRALSRYYIDAGAGGLAVGVHTTQFAVRDVGLYRPVLELAAETALDWTMRPIVLIAGLTGHTRQAIKEAQVAVGIGFHAGLLSLAAMRGANEDELIEHCAAVAKEIPLVGFYLQPAVGGLVLSASFWRRFAALDNVVAVKIAPFNRYRTIDVVRGLVEAQAEDRITLYTGNDDHILLDLVTPFTVMRAGGPVSVHVKGGLLGHWSVWTQRAVDLFQECRRAAASGKIPTALLALDSEITDCNGALFDVANDFRGCIAGCHEVLRRQGLLQGIWCIDPGEGLSPGQAEEIDRVYEAYPALNDDAFVRTNLHHWLSTSASTRHVGQLTWHAGRTG